MGRKKQVIQIQHQDLNKHWDDAFHEFIQYCSIKNLSEYTIEFYKRYYKKLKVFLDSNNLTGTQDINKDIFNQFILNLKTYLANAISINSCIRGVRAFLYYCMRLEYTNEFKIETIKAEKKIKETYTDAELMLLLKKPDMKKCNFAEYRDWVIINYLLSTGNRLGTVINIKVKNLDFHNEYILLERTKNKKQQLIPMSKTLSKILQEYLVHRKGSDEEYLFCNVSGQKLTKDSIINTIRKYNHNRGVKKSSIHLFRHTFAKKWILSGGDIFRLQVVLGHSSLEVVKEYVNLFSNELKLNFDKFNPLEQLNKNNTYIRLNT